MRDVVPRVVVHATRVVVRDVVRVAVLGERAGGFRKVAKHERRRVAPSRKEAGGRPERKARKARRER